MSPESELHPNNAEWLSKRDAARLLGVGERQIERQAAAGKIRTRREPRQPHQTAAPVLFSREDVEAIKAGTPNYYPVVEKRPAAGSNDAGAVASGEPETQESKAILPAAPAAPAGAALERLAQLLAAPPAPPAKPWLSISEAAAFSGLPAAFLRRHAPDLAPIGYAVDVSRGGRPRWRILRAALERSFPAR
jgi:hypothetical protein